MKSVSLNIPLSGEVLGFHRHTSDYFCVKGWTSRRHNNSLDELHIILSGSCQIEVEDKQYFLTPGSAILVRAGKFHGPPKLQQNVERCSFLLNVPHGGFLDHQFELLSHGTIPISNEIISLCHQLDSDAEDTAPFYKDILVAKLTIIIIKILQTVNAKDIPTDTITDTPGLHGMLVAIDRFFCPWPNAIGSETDLAQKLNISRHKLNRIICQNYGMSFREKLRNAKMDYASWLLRRTDYSCKQIATLCGYSADTAFHKAFRENFGMPAQAYRKLYNKGSTDP